MILIFILILLLLYVTGHVPKHTTFQCIFHFLYFILESVNVQLMIFDKKPPVSGWSQINLFLEHPYTEIDQSAAHIIDIIHRQK